MSLISETDPYDQPLMEKSRRFGRDSAFDRDWYLAAYPDAAEASIDPLEHYTTYGERAGHHPTPAAAKKAKLAILAKSYHFNGNISAPSSKAEARIGFDTESAPTFNSAKYWQNRYRIGGNSGAGSYGRLADFKAEVINAFVRKNNITSVIEFGCGDGAQLALANYPAYLGFDVADESVELCRSKFSHDLTKAFRNAATWDYETADLTLSLDVIYHLIEDSVFHDYMRKLFASAKRYVIIYSSNYEGRWPAAHVMHRRFTDWVDIYHADFKLVRYVPNSYPLIDDDQNQSFADFFIFEKQPSRQHTLPGHLIVSLTSYSKRFPTLELTLRRILQQSIQPDEIILWLAEEDRRQLPEGVLFLQRCGLTIRVTKDLRSYKKIIPALENYPDSFIITFDDDMAYPVAAIESLVAHYRSPTEILCRRAHKITYDANGKPLPYNQWQFDVAQSGPDLFATGCQGILYPPRSLACEVLEETTFVALAPLADDIWLFWMGRLAGSTVRKVGPHYAQEMWPGCHEQGLWINHNEKGGNDPVIRALTARYGSAFGQNAEISTPPKPNREPPVNAQGGDGSALRALFKHFAWSESSAGRNELTCRYEPFQPFLFVTSATALECTIVLDIGANIGAYSVLSTRAPTVETIHAFEVEEAAFAELKRNILLNRLEDKIKSHCIAASNHDGFVNFGVARPMAGNNGVIDTSIHSVDVYGETRQVPSMALDKLFSYMGRSIALKIDVEGHEYNVLEGCKNILVNNKCVIQIEIYNEDIRITDFFREIGYTNFFKVGPDHYFSNNDLFRSSERVLLLLEAAIGEMVQFSLNGTSARATAIDASQNSTEAMANADIQAALDTLQQNDLGGALAIFADAFRDGIGLPAERVASVMIEVASALISAFEIDGQSPAAYHFFRTVGPEAAEVIAGLLELANFPAGNEDPAALSEPIMLAYAGSLSAAGRHDDAVGILARLLGKSPNRLPLSHAMFVAQRRQASLSKPSRMAEKRFSHGTDREQAAVCREVSRSKIWH